MGRIWRSHAVATWPRRLRLRFPRFAGCLDCRRDLAASFAVLALVPVQPFREFAFIMGVGVLIDAFWCARSCFPRCGSGRTARFLASPEGRPARSVPGA